MASTSVSELIICVSAMSPEASHEHGMLPEELEDVLAWVPQGDGNLALVLPEKV